MTNRALVRAALLACLVAVLAPAGTASAQAASGVVVDPQDRRIAGAAAVLSCHDGSRVSATNGAGEFSLALPGGTLDGCVLTVAAQGFAAWSLAFGPGGRLPSIVRLALAPIAETVDVRAPAPPPTPAVRGVTLLADDLRAISNDPNDILRYASALAGTGDERVVYVDGFPATQLPPATRMASVAVDTDPFSVEYSDPGARRIEITTIEPDRRWRPTFDAAPPGAGGGNPLASGHRSRSRDVSAGLSGPTPWLTGSFSVSAGMNDSESTPVIVAVVPDREPAEEAGTTARSRRRRVSLQLNQKLAATTRLRIEATRATSRGTGEGIGGEVLADAGTTRASSNTAVRARLVREAAGTTITSQVRGEWQRQSLAATGAGGGTWVPGAFIAGGDSMLWSGTDRVSIQAKSVVTSMTGNRPWRAGVAIDREAVRSRRTPNPAGYLQFSSLGAWSAAAQGSPLGTLYRAIGQTDQQAALVDVAVFADTALVQRPSAGVRGGVRVDWQSRDQVRVSPRVSGSARWHGWTLGGGAGLFTLNWAADLLIGTRAAEGETPVLLIASGVPLSGTEVSGVESRPVVSDLMPGLARGRYTMTTASLDRRLGPLSVGAEHTWWRGRHLLGSRRLPDAVSSGWIDWLESSRSSDSHELRGRVALMGATRSLAFTYGWHHSADNTDGAFSFPASQEDLGSEWARSARIPGQGCDLVASSVLPARVRATAIVTLRGRAPYNIVSGLDVEGNGLTTDRAGLARNSGEGPAYRSVSLYLSRRLDLSSLFGSRLKLPIDMGVRADNLLGAKNWTAFGHVLGSPLFGQPEGAFPGRSVRIWFTLAR